MLNSDPQSWLNQPPGGLPLRKLGYSIKGEPLAYEEIYSVGTDGDFIHDIYIHGKKTTVDHCEYLGAVFRYEERYTILSWEQYVPKWISSRISLAYERTEIAPCYAKTDKIWPAWIYKLIKNEWLDSKDALSLWIANLHTRDYPDIIPVYSARTRQFVFDYSSTYRRQYYLWSLRQVEYFVFDHSDLELHHFEERDLAARTKYAAKRGQCHKYHGSYVFLPIDFASSYPRVTMNTNDFDGDEMNVLSHTVSFSIRKQTPISYLLEGARVPQSGSRNQKIEADKRAFANRKKSTVRQIAHRKIYNDKPRQKSDRKNRRYRQ